MPAVQSKEMFLAWMTFFHEQVDRRLKKPDIDCVKEIVSDIQKLCWNTLAEST